MGIADSGLDHNADLAVRIHSVFQSTWNDFYTWEQRDAQQTLANLAPEFPRFPVPPSKFSPPVAPLALDAEAELFTVLDYTSLDGTPEATTLPVEVVQVTPPFQPCAAYEMCTPVNRNFNVGDDSEYMPFVPLADDPAFNYIRHAEDYQYFEWQIPNSDPDLGTIVIETAHRLQAHHGISFQDIDNSKVLPLSILSAPGNLLRASSRRDFPKWPTFKSRPAPLEYIPTHALDNSNSTLPNLIPYFCNNINCMVSYCTVHLGELSMPPPTIPNLTSNAIASAVEAPCGAGCFLLGKGPSLGNIWSTEDIDTLRTILSISPDTSPCDLAYICRKPCREVFKHRQDLYPDKKILKQSEKLARTRSGRAATFGFKDHDTKLFTPNEPCSHLGPCDDQSQCPCFLNGAHCETGCRCDRKCNRRWQGCTCARSRLAACGTNKCRCFLAHRECCPTVCLKCESRGAFLVDKYLCLRTKPRADASSNLCKNSAIQRGHRKATEVRQSQWGLGLYAAEPIKKNDFIVEYTGEIILEPTTLCRDFVSQHRGRTYVFQLNSTMSIDSSKVGNTSRFVNHNANPNCYALVRLVNGEHRIGFFAERSIGTDEEILINYGDSFFSPETAVEVKVQTDPDVVVYQLDQHSSDETYAE